MKFEKLMMSTSTNLTLQKILANKAICYDAIVIGEDQNASLYGIIFAVQEATQGKIPLYIGKSIDQLEAIRHQLINNGLRAFYLLDNKYNPNTTEPQGQNLIKEWRIEQDVVLITSDYKYIKDVPYPVFDKLQPEF